jgi:chromosome segregation ATPase
MSGIGGITEPRGGLHDVHAWAAFVKDPDTHVARIEEFLGRKAEAEKAIAQSRKHLATATAAGEALAKERAAFVELKTSTDQEHSTVLTAIADRNARVQAREEAVQLREQMADQRIAKFETDNKDIILQIETREKTVSDDEAYVAKAKRDVEKMKARLQAKLDAIAAIHQVGQ